MTKHISYCFFAVFLSVVVSFWFSFLVPFFFFLSLFSFLPFPVFVFLSFLPSFLASSLCLLSFISLSLSLFLFPFVL